MRFEKLATLTAVIVGALAFGPGTGAAQFGQTWTMGGDSFYQSTNPAACATVDSWLWAWTPGQTLRVRAVAWATQGSCDLLGAPDYVPPPGYFATRLTLFKWDGQSAQICMTYPDWTYSDSWNPAAAAVDFVVAPGCGDGHYNLRTEGCAWLDGAWRCGTAFSDWLWIDVQG